MNVYFRNLKRALLASLNTGTPPGPPPSDEFTYTVNSDEVTITTDFYIGESTAALVPVKISSRQITVLGPTTFSGQNVSIVTLSQDWSGTTVTGVEEIM